MSDFILAVWALHWWILGGVVMLAIFSGIQSVAPYLPSHEVPMTIDDKKRLDESCEGSGP
jgi:hypothetical protein